MPRVHAGVCVCVRDKLRVCMCVYMCEGGRGGEAGRLAESGDGGGGSESLIG